VVQIISHNSNRYKIMKKLLLLSLVVVFSITACEKEPFVLKDGAELTDFDRKVLEDESYLELSSFKAFADSAQIMSKLSKAELDKWETEHNFISLGRVYESMTQFEISQFAEEEDLLKKNPELIRTMKHKFSPLTEHLAKSIKNSPEE
jgi:hypothetical protein